jgi:peptide/nickel transport system ATP-binding protein
MTALLQITGLTIDIARDTGPARVVDGIDLTVNEGESLGIVGESGCGKSLTMLSLVGLLPNRIRATGGTARFGGRDLLKLSAGELRKVRGAEIGFIFQDPMTSLNPYMRVGDQLAEGLIVHKGLSKARPGPRPCGCWTWCAFPMPRPARGGSRTNCRAGCGSG